MTAVRVLLLVIAIGALMAAGAAAGARGVGLRVPLTGPVPFGANAASPTAPPRIAASPASPLPVASTSPAPSQGVLSTGDPRSNGGGPGLVGAPFVIALGVVLLGGIAAGGTLLYVRLAHND